MEIFIILVATLSGIIFHLYLLKRIRQWAANDLIKALAKGNSEKEAFLHAKYQEMNSNKTPRKKHPTLLEQYAKEFEEARG